MAAADFEPYELSRWAWDASITTTDTIYPHFYPSDYFAARGSVWGVQSVRRRTFDGVDRLIPNVANPRHVPVDTPEAAVGALVDRMPRKILSLARDIAEFGLDPSTLPIVIEEGAFFVALEGNRRVAALLLMQNPDLLPLEASLHASSIALHDQDVVPDEIACIIFDEREEADHWIELRHTGENEGAGIVRWGAPE